MNVTWTKGTTLPRNKNLHENIYKTYIYRSDVKHRSGWLPKSKDASCTAYANVHESNFNLRMIKYLGDASGFGDLMNPIQFYLWLHHTFSKLLCFPLTCWDGSKCWLKVIKSNKSQTKKVNLNIVKLWSWFHSWVENVLCR